MTASATTAVAVHPYRWFIAGVATALVLVALIAGLALATLQASRVSGERASGTTPFTQLDRGWRDQRAGEIGAGSVGSEFEGLTDQRRGEINGGD